jgi:hypothetical protein
VKVQTFVHYSDSGGTSLLSHRHETTAACPKEDYSEIGFHQIPMYPRIDFCLTPFHNAMAESVLTPTEMIIKTPSERKKECHDQNIDLKMRASV